MCEATLRVAALTILTWLSLISAAAPAQVSPAPAQISPAPSEEPVQVVEAFTLKHQPADDAVDLVRSVLSPRGRVELQGGGKTLVIRDSAKFVAKARIVLTRYDHEVMNIAFTIRLVKASTQPKASKSGLPAALTNQLQKMLRYEHFEELGHAEVAAKESQEVGYGVGDDFRIQFRVGTVLESRHIRLHDFQVFRLAGDGEKKSLIHTRLVIRLDQTFILGLARSEESGEALMVVLNTFSRRLSAPRR